MAAASTAGSDVELCGWGCAMCTFENEHNANACAICLTPRRATPIKSTGSNSTSPALSSKSTASFSTKKQRSNSTLTKRTIQQPLVAVGSSSEKEALRLQKKVAQMKELGIDLPANELLALLARNCYSVTAAASAFFEQLSTNDTDKTAVDAETERRVAAACRYFEAPSSFAREPFRLVGSQVIGATRNRAGVAVAIGDRLVLQAEHAGKKRLRPGAAATAVTNSSTSSTVPVAATLSSGMVRVATEHNTLIGRLDRDVETVFHPLMKSGLVILGGVCESAPTSAQMFAPFTVRVFVFVHSNAFAIFDDTHAQFHLSDALYTALELVHVDAKPPTAPAPTASNGADADRGLDALFADFVGAGADDVDDRDDVRKPRRNHPADDLAPLLQDITLRSHQRAALQWMLARENQRTGSCAQTAAADELNPMWETRLFGDSSGRSYYVNRFEKIALLARPQPPTPCLGGILADDMGMGKTMMVLALVAYQKHFGTGSAAQPQAPAQTLIVCPLSLLHQWKNEVTERFCASALRVHVHYGDDRERASALARADIVLTTYGVLSQEFDRANSSSTSTKISTSMIGTGSSTSTTLTGTGVLARTWHRVILDEAHSIKNRATTYFRACAALCATRRWCLTGTPLQNALDDVFALLKFLEYEPWNRLAAWQRVIALPFERGDEAAALARLKVVLTPVLLRRTKHSVDRHGNRLVLLPPKRIDVVRLTFSAQERVFYDAVFAKSRMEFRGFVAHGAARASYVAIFALLLRLRQACDHPLLALGRDFEQTPSASTPNKNPNKNKSGLFSMQPGEATDAYYARIATQLQHDLEQQQQTTSTGSIAAIEPAADGARGLTPLYITRVLAQVEDGLETHECPVCLDPPVCGVLTPCAHVLCEECLRASLASDPDGGCPVCRAPVDMAKVFRLPPAANNSSIGSDKTKVVTTAKNTGSDKTEDVTTPSMFISTKLQQLLLDLTAIRQANDEAKAMTPETYCKRKVVVFSQWAHMLEMVAQLLTTHQFKHCLFHGSMTQDTRERVLTQFAKDPEVDVLVISLKAGGVGLNLTCASVVILLDPWWNPGVEDQAIDRVHRLGQNQDVVVKRYVVSDTVEDMILTLQERKAALATHVLVASRNGDDDKRNERLSLDDLKRFFQP